MRKSVREREEEEEVEETRDKEYTVVRTLGRSSSCVVRYVMLCYVK